MQQAQQGWASCPLTQNGFLRVISQPKYPKPIATSQAIDLLQAAVSTPHHEFWPADLSLVDSTQFERGLIHGPRQLTDLYLLALAVSRGGCLATFDSAIPLNAVACAKAANLVLV